MLIFKPKTKRYKISVDIEAKGTISFETDIPLNKDSLEIKAWSAIYEKLSKIEQQTGITFEPDSKTLKVEEEMENETA